MKRVTIERKNAGFRRGRRFMATTRPMRSVWSLGEIYSRPTKWATIFRSRQAGNRIDESMSRLRNELIDCIMLGSPIMDSIKHSPDIGSEA